MEIVTLREVPQENSEHTSNENLYFFLFFYAVEGLIVAVAVLNLSLSRLKVEQKTIKSQTPLNPLQRSGCGFKIPGDLLKKNEGCLPFFLLKRVLKSAPFTLPSR